MNHYETLRETVYKILYPEGIPLEFGCEIIVSGIAKDNPGCELDVVLYGTQARRNEGFIPTEYYGEVRLQEIEKILGKPLSIVDVLRALEKVEHPFSFAIRDDGRVLNLGSMRIYTKINLALPLSAPENSEACKAIINLLK